MQSQSQYYEKSMRYVCRQLFHLISPLNVLLKFTKYTWQINAHTKFSGVALSVDNGTI